MLALTRGRMGQLSRAEELFDEAVAAFGDVSPSQLARIEFERGTLYEAAGDVERARAWYDAAVDRLPQYAHAAAHLAALLPPRQAKRVLEAAGEVSDDPEVLAALADADDALSEGSGAEVRRRAARHYDALMQQLPQAFADHAGWFYLYGVEQADKAVDAAELNLRVRQGPEAYELLIAALAAVDETDEACRRADEGMAHRYPSRELRRVAAAAYRRCGQQDRADELEVDR